jgi:hypothetical protein
MVYLSTAGQVGLSNPPPEMEPETFYSVGAEIGRAVPLNSDSVIESSNSRTPQPYESVAISRGYCHRGLFMLLRRHY